MSFPTERGIMVVVTVDSEQHRSSELSALVGLDADESWDQGSAYLSGTRTAHHRFSRWSVQECACGDDNWDRSLDRLLARLQPIEVRFRSLPSTVTVSFSVFLTEDNGVFSFGLQKAHAQFIAAIGAEISLSVVVISPLREVALSNKSTERKFEVHVGVDSEVHTRDELEAMFPMIPDETWGKGERFQSPTGREMYRKFSRWAIIERDGDIEDWRATVERLIVRLRPIEAAFRRLPPEAHVGMTMFVAEDNGVFGFGLDRHQIEFMVSIGAELDMSFVVSCPSPPDKGTSR